jgi:predicted small secreted protein
MKRKNQRLLLLLALVATFAFMLSSCNLIIGLRQTSPNYKGPKAIEKWWNDQQP